MIVDLVLAGAEVWDERRLEKVVTGRGKGKGATFVEGDRRDDVDVLRYGDGYGDGRGFGVHSGNGKGLACGREGGYPISMPCRECLRWSIP